MMQQLLKSVNRHFGSYRGLIRLWLAHMEYASGQLRHFRCHNLSHVARLIFVCHGNICRSLFADHLARSLGVPNASFGLRATTGESADLTAMKLSPQFGVDLGSHKVTDIKDFQFHQGDLLLAMETRQAHKLSSLSLPDGVQITLLGNWSKPFRPHIHDPSSLSEDYFFTCYQVMEMAMKQLCRKYVVAKVGVD